MLNENGYFGLDNSNKVFEAFEELLQEIEPEFEEIVESARWETVVDFESEEP